VVGTGFALIGLNVDAEILQNAARHPLWQKLKPAVMSLRLDDRRPASSDGVHAFRVTDDIARTTLTAHASEILVVRPDRYIAAAAAAPAFGDVCDVLVGRLG
jgi:hypothetical protein